MKIVNRSSITVTHKKPFIDWHNNLMPEMPLDENTIGDSSTYLIKELSGDIEKIIKKNYIAIFQTELWGMWTDENDWPEKISFKKFLQWFSVEVSEPVYDLEKRNLVRSEFDL